jgi:hypothetical protein
MPDACRRLALFELMYFATLELCSTATENSSIQKALKNLNHLTHCPKIGVHFTYLPIKPSTVIKHILSCMANYSNFFSISSLLGE